MNILKRRAFLIATISFLALAIAQSCKTVEEAGTPVEAENTPTAVSSDRQTTDRLNAGSEPPERETSGREDAGAKDSALLVTSTNTAVAPAEADFNIASLYTRITVKGIPVIENPNCGMAPADIRITVFNPDRIRGHIVVDLYNHVKEDFLDPEKAILRIITRVTGEETPLCVPVDGTGDYAFALYHDKNSNEKWDKNFLGIPRERFALSNNPDYGMRTPDFQKVVFTVPPGGVEQRIRLMSSGDVISGKRG